jgi:hypothetical protein
MQQYNSLESYFSSELSKIVDSSRDKIMELTWFCSNHHNTISQSLSNLLIDKIREVRKMFIMKVPVKRKLHLLYLLDSITKHV